MRRKIQRSMCLVAFLALLISGILTVAAVYQQTVMNKTAELRQEAEYIQAAVDIAGEEYLNVMDNVQKSTRLTLVGQDGTVLYDSVQDDTTLENHKNRKEIKGAMENGRGEAVRTSDTLGQKTFYYAIRLQDGTVLRASQTIDNVLPTIRKLLPYIIGIFLLMVAGAYLLAKWQTKRLIDPINHLDLEHPLENDVYEELTPLLQGIDVQNREKEKAAEMRKEFSANVSHELKTPLMSISGYAEIMKNNMVPPDKVPDFAGRIYEEASRLTNLVQDIIEISKLDEGISMPFELVDVSELAEEIGTTLLVEAEKRKIKLSVEAEKQTMVNGVRHILYEMMYNVADNAIKYNHEGGYVKVKVKKNQNQVQISIEDNGIGIKKEEQERIFERFYRVDKSHSKKTGGTGLGLSIVKHGAILHDARIEIDSEPERGTKIILILKRADVHQK